MINIEEKLILPKGFLVSGVHAGLKKKKLDMALIFSESLSVSSSAYTTNKVKAAPVLFDMAIKTTPKRGIVINSGNANACTGEKGYKDTQKMAELCATILGGCQNDYFVASTGVIGVPLDMEKIEGGINSLTNKLSNSEDEIDNVATAILTTDTHKKCVSASFCLDGKSVTISGFAKGSGMIHPNMATTLSFVMTDALIDQEILQRLTGKDVENTFNMISVDGDTSTNDSCFVLANGESLLDCSSGVALELFSSALELVLKNLAMMLVKDGEGAEKFIEAEVNGAIDEKNAKVLARSIISSSLVKAAFFGSDANWGRILCAMGYSGADFDPNKTDLYFESKKGRIQTLKCGEPICFDEDIAKKILLEKEVRVVAVLNQGSGKATAWGCDLTYEYVKINGDYRS